MRSFNAFPALRILAIAICATILITGLANISVTFFQMATWVEIAGLCVIYIFALTLIGTSKHRRGWRRASVKLTVLALMVAALLWGLLSIFYRTMPQAEGVLPVGEFVFNLRLLLAASVIIGCTVILASELVDIQLSVEITRMRIFDWVLICGTTVFLIFVYYAGARMLK